MLTSVLSFLIRYAHILIPLATISHFVSNKYRYGLNKYPGPWLAAYTDWWRFFDNVGQRSEKTFIELHRQYGDIVRIGPNVLSFADPRVLKTIYGLNKGFTKSEFYPVQQGVVKGHRLPWLFSSTNEAYHAHYRRCVNGAFGMSSLVSYEALVESTLSIFLNRTEELFERQRSVCNFGRWLQFFAFDVIGELTWSKRIGFIERNEDVGGIIEFIAGFLEYAGPVGQMPFLDLILKKNVVHMWLQRLGLSKTVFPATKFALERSAEREEEMCIVKSRGLEGLQDGAQVEAQENRGVDLLSKFTQAQYEHPETMTDDLVLTTCLSMVLAGSETTAISLSSVFYHLLKNPRMYKKLMTEMRVAARDGTIEDNDERVVSWAASQKLPSLP